VRPLAQEESLVNPYTSMQLITMCLGSKMGWVVYYSGIKRTTEEDPAVDSIYIYALMASDTAKATTPKMKAITT